MRSRTVRSYSLSTSCVAPFLRTWSFRFDKNASAGSGIHHTSAVSDRFRLGGTAESIVRALIFLLKGLKPDTFMNRQVVEFHWSGDVTDLIGAELDPRKITDATRWSVRANIGHA